MKAENVLQIALQIWRMASVFCGTFQTVEGLSRLASLAHQVSSLEAQVGRLVEIVEDCPPEQRARNHAAGD